MQPFALLRQSLNRFAQLLSVLPCCILDCNHPRLRMVSRVITVKCHFSYESRMVSLYLGLLNPDASYRGVKQLKRPKKGLEGPDYVQPSSRPQRGLRKAPRGLYGHGMDKQTFGGLRTPACGWTPTGAGPTASPLRGFGHLLAMIGDRNPARPLGTRRSPRYRVSSVLKPATR